MENTMPKPGDYILVLNGDPYGARHCDGKYLRVIDRKRPDGLRSWKGFPLDFFTEPIRHDQPYGHPMEKEGEYWIRIDAAWAQVFKD